MEACKNDYCHKKVVGSKPYLFSGKIKKAPHGAFLYDTDFVCRFN